MHKAAKTQPKRRLSKHKLAFHTSKPKPFEGHPEFPTATHNHKFVSKDGRVRGTAYHDQKGNVVGVDAEHGPTRMKINEDGIFEINDEHNMFYLGTLENEVAEGKVRYHMLGGMHPRSLYRAQALFNSVGKRYLPRMGVREIKGQTPNVAIVDLAKKHFNAKVKEYTPTSNERRLYRNDASRKISDPRFSADGKWYEIHVPTSAIPLNKKPRRS